MADAQQGSLLGESSPEKPGEGPVVLVADDDPDILRIVKFFLTKQNFRVFAAEDGDVALEMLRANPEIELILSDVMMPRMSGLELLAAVRKDPKLCQIPVLLISAEGETSKKVAGLTLGADDFISKPFNFDELMARVRNHLNLRRLQRELVVANEKLQEQNLRFLEDLETAKTAQLALMPDNFPQRDGYRFGARYLPVDRVGGDFFDMVELDGGKKVGVLIADVCGHGVAAAFITAMTKITFRNACYTSLLPGEVLSQMNRELKSSLRSGFVTAFYGVLDCEKHSLAYASGGHPPLLVFRGEKNEIIDLSPQATFLGFFDGVEFPTSYFSVQGGDRILFYTDGLFESHNEPGEQYGMERVTALVGNNRDKGIQSLVDTLIDDLGRFIAPTTLDDDITVVGLDILP